MARVQIKVIRFEKLNDAPLALIFVDNDLEPHSASYLLSVLDRGHPLSQIKTTAFTIKRFFDYCIEYRIDFPACFKRMDPLPSGTIEHLAGFLSARIDTGEPVGPNTFKYRWSHIKAFLKHVWRFYQERVVDPDALKAAQVKQAMMEEALKEYGTFGYKADKKDHVGLKPELIAEFFNIVFPSKENDLNPWKSELIRWRNYCLFLTMILGSNRKGESLNLTINDFALTGPANQPRYFEFQKHDTVMSDYGTRSIRPAQKTKGRRVVLAPQLAEVFEHYITHIRPKFKGAKRYPHMFLSLRDGEPISVNTPNESLKQLIEKHPQFKGLLSPHILRNTWADMVNEALDEKYQHQGPLAKQGLKAAALEYGGGWAKGSAMVERYPKGSTERAVAELHLQIHERIFTESKEESNGKKH
ncbi:site-specific integrase [Marinobacterium mangrovicola]|uniref:Phage integrase family protein n=1 Tax=Marinobacterium mangrovicola TaxID=1476959 RepID=A0A4R1H8D8_9GAMM|nr:site-specific integrase [Marinobacterium mangrovicola]TCK16420.1 hypothetical protein CLV83_0128 [Marinobacterium mangrovicola]